MSIQYCEGCNRHIDLDYNSEHFIILKDGTFVCERNKTIHYSGIVTDEDGFVLGDFDY